MTNFKDMSVEMMIISFKYVIFSWYSPPPDFLCDYFKTNLQILWHFCNTKVESNYPSHKHGPNLVSQFYQIEWGEAISWHFCRWTAGSDTAATLLSLLYTLRRYALKGLSCHVRSSDTLKLPWYRKQVERPPRGAPLVQAISFGVFLAGAPGLCVKKPSKWPQAQRPFADNLMRPQTTQRSHSQILESQKHER